MLRILRGLDTDSLVHSFPKAIRGILASIAPIPTLSPWEGVFELALTSTLARTAPSPAKGRVGVGLADGKSTLWAFCHLCIALFFHFPIDMVAFPVAGGKEPK